MKFTGLLIMGFGGHGRSVADVALACGYKDILFYDENAREGENFLGYPVQADLPAALPDGWACFPASGDSAQRRAWMALAQQRDWPVATLIAPSATIGVAAEIRGGCLIAQQAHLGPMAQVGEGCIVNTGAVLEHECILGAFSHLSVNATVAGRSRVGEDCFIGAGAVLIDKIKVAAKTIVAAGAVVTQSFETPALLAGVPATVKRSLG